MVEFKRISVESFLESLFHSESFSQAPEQQRQCPFGKCFNHEFETHNELIDHMFTEHHDEVKSYIDSIDYIIKNPVDNINFSYWLADLTGHPSASMSCAFCGEDLSEQNVTRHMNLAHKKEFEAVEEMLKEY